MFNSGMRPIHPGEILREDYLVPLGMSAMHWQRRCMCQRHSQGEAGVTADTAMRLARYFDTTPQFWMTLQAEYDLRVAQIERADQIAREVAP